jgi:hypothetical protein
MSKLAETEPELEPEVLAAARQCLEHKRANVRQLAQSLVA